MGCSSSKEGTGAQVVPFLTNGGADGAANQQKGKGGSEPWGEHSDMPPDTTVVFCIGDPASGKTTMCKKLLERYQYTHLVPGDLLREEVEKGTVTGKWANDLMQQGKQVPDQVPISLLKNAMIAATKHAALSNNVMLVDGFPRTMEQVMLCQHEMGMAHAVIYLEVPEQVARARWMSDGGSEDAFKSVYQKAKKQSQGLKQHYVSQGNCHVVDASKGPNAVFSEISRLMEQLEQKRSEDFRARASGGAQTPSSSGTGDGARSKARSRSADGSSSHASPAGRTVAAGHTPHTSVAVRPTHSPALAGRQSFATDSPESTGRKDPLTMTLGGGSNRVSGSGGGSLQPKTPIPKRLQPLQPSRKDAGGAGGAGASGAAGSGEETVPPGGMRAPWQRTPMAAPQRIAPLKLSMGQHDEIGEVEEKFGALSGKRRLDMSNLDDRRMLDQLLDHVRNSPSRANSPHARASPHGSPHGAARLSPGGQRSISRQGSIAAAGYQHTRFSTPGHIGDDPVDSPPDRYSTPRGAASRQGSLARQLHRYESRSHSPGAGGRSLSRQGSVAGTPRAGFVPDLASGGSPGRKVRSSMPGNLLSQQTSLARRSVESEQVERARTQSGAGTLHKQVSLSTRPPPPASGMRTSAPGTMPRGILRKSDPSPAPLAKLEEAGRTADSSSGGTSGTRQPSPASSRGGAGAGAQPAPGVTRTSNTGTSLGRQTSTANQRAPSPTPGAGTGGGAKGPGAVYAAAAAAATARQSSIARGKPPALSTTSTRSSAQGLNRQPTFSAEPSPTARSPSPLGQKSSSTAATAAAASSAPGTAGVGAAAAGGKASSNGSNKASASGAGQAAPRDPSPSPLPTTRPGGAPTSKLTPLRQPSPRRSGGALPGVERVAGDVLSTNGGDASPLPSPSPRLSGQRPSGGPLASTAPLARLPVGRQSSVVTQPTEPSLASAAMEGRPKTQGPPITRQVSLGPTSAAAAAAAKARGGAPAKGGAGAVAAAKG